MQTIIDDLAPTGTLRAAINLGNGVLAQGTPTSPAGVSVDIAREVARRLGVGVTFVCFDAARQSFQAVVDGDADIGFLAVEPARESSMRFTAPYAVIEGAYAVRRDAPIADLDEIDRSGVRVGVKLGSAYDLFLTRTLKNAEIVRGTDGITVCRDRRLEVAAGIRAPLEQEVAGDPDLRMLAGAFMEIRQALATSVARRQETTSFLTSLIEDVKRSGFVARSLQRSGQHSATVAAAASDRSS